MVHPLSRHADWQEPFPAWVERFRGHQWIAARQIVAAFDDGVKVVVLDAPTGSGKTLIAEMVRRMLACRGVYVCSDKGLQDQFAKDYPEARVLKGRGNYPTGRAGVYADACDKADGACTWCKVVEDCPYERAKRDALSARLAVLNTSYLLTECNGPGRFSGRDFVVVDECDVLERSLMGFVEVFVSTRRLEELGLEAPIKGSHLTTIVKWCRDDLLPGIVGAVNRIRGRDAASIKRANGWTRLAGDITRMCVEVERGDGEWIRDNDAGPLVLKPVTVDTLGERYLWQHARKWLVMSATVVSADEMMGSLGVGEGEWAVVKCPMTFAVENRPVVVAPVADMSFRAKQWDECAHATREICRQHFGERVLVHAVSHALAQRLATELRRDAREVVTYSKAADREDAVRRFRGASNSVLIAASLERGVDLAGDDCRVVIVAKVPFPYLGDKQVAARMHRGREGAVWYAVQTIRVIVQMTGRGVRSDTDHATSYIIDSQFMKLWAQWKRLFPAWWAEAVVWDRDTRALRMTVGDRG